MFPTVREVLALDSMRAGEPRLVAGEAGLDRRVRWVHSADVHDIASLLRGGELMLTTGIGLPADDEGIRGYLRELSEAGVVGLVVELGRRYTGSVPKVMAAAAQKLNLPLVELRRPTPFVPITQAVHSMIVDAQLSELRAAEEVHQRFTDLSVEGADPAEVVHQAAELSGCPVVLENLARQVLAFDTAGERASLVLDGWEQHSRRVQTTGRTGYDADSGWLVTMVGARGQDWGRLLLRFDAHEGEPPTRLIIVLERAATTLALGRLIERDAEGLARQLHGTLLSALLEHSLPVDEVALRARALGVTLERRKLAGVAIRTRSDELPAPEQMRELTESVGQAIRESALDGLVSPVDDMAVGALIALRQGSDPHAALEGFASALRRHTKEKLIVAAGSDVDNLRQARRSLIEARQVADAARHDPDSAITVHRLPHVGLAGLLFLLRDEPRLQTFVERQLGALLTYDAEHAKEPLLPALRAYLDHGRNKSAAAAAAHLSRPAFYERLARIGKVLNADLESVPVCLSLHVALLALDALRHQ
ncbi:PucR family transcriptional regulator [Catelliglobosispora koreensis]|uniref:PucR family transcriptional regulator n=1 Tax=Catelliglobosispora koreensis TaxID=129052 RepID=UPI00035FE097|nr:PucR family transcriptional regulator ligand-binding domain-containing protein [Catelliglobosispora koreensis]